MRDTPRQVLWSSTQRLTVWLLCAWLLVSLLGPWFAIELNQFQVLGFPLGFWVVGQGSLLAYLLIILVCILRMEWLESRYQAELELADRQASDTGAQVTDARAPAP